MGTFDWWDDVFQQLPPEVLDDYLRILRAVHRHFEGRIIRSPGLRDSAWFSIDAAGRLRGGRADASHFTPNPYAGERGLPGPAEGHLHDLMTAYPDCRCGALVTGNIIFKYWWPGRRRIEDTAVDVHLAHRPPAGVNHGFFRLPFETEGRLVRRMRMDPDTVEFIERAR
ncbi:hypothetical protein [Actinomadura harenae]|uniref:Uncharacterized protein n=1 Tax=Actinomadura harenae TaxID=2483351 RepID=A0A3M2M365_9ACTN|nr:hypothetical protein [Actinomadura harenae]RMI44039.1 hypothetical protein EBO15_14030 [Actinomadura harenae]